MPSLFDPIKLGAVEAPNRILMAPLTRGRSTREHVPTALMQTYYSQRAGAGLILTEATGIPARRAASWTRRWSTELAERISSGRCGPSPSPSSAWPRDQLVSAASP